MPLQATDIMHSGNGEQSARACIVLPARRAVGLK